MNLFQSYLVKYAYGGCDAMGSLNSSDLLQEKLESILSDLDKPELEHAAPVADKVVEITVVKTSADPKLIKGLINYGLKLATKAMPMFNYEDLADTEVNVGYSLPKNKDTKVDTVKEDSTEQLNDDKAPYHTAASDLLSPKDIPTDTALA